MECYEVQEMKDNLFMFSDILGSQGRDISKALDYMEELENMLINNKKPRIIKVEESDIMGYASNTKFFYSLNKAKKYFKKLFKAYKSEIVDAGQCGYQDNPIQWNEIKGNGRKKDVSLEHWTSYETEDGTQHDTTLTFITLEELEVEQ